MRRLARRLQFEVEGLLEQPSSRVEVMLQKKIEPVGDDWYVKRALYHSERALYHSERALYYPQRRRSNSFAAIRFNNPMNFKNIICELVDRFTVELQVGVLVYGISLMQAGTLVYDISVMQVDMYRYTLCVQVDI